MTFTAPVVAGPETEPGIKVVTHPTLYVTFAAGRRGAGSVDCKTCGKEIHQHVDMSEPGYSYDPMLSWYDGSGESGGWYSINLAEDVGGSPMLPTQHEHEPAFEMGPTFGPFSYVENTYATVRVDEGETLAIFSANRGDWIIADDGEYAGQAYSDITIFAEDQRPTAGA